MLPRDDCILRQFVLPLVQVVAQKRRLTIDVEAQRGLQALLIRNLEFIVRKTEYQREARLRAEKVRDKILY